MTAPGRLSWTDVRDRIRARILNRTYAPGDRLPRDEDLALELGCARATVHRAMQELSQSGLIDRKRKGGTHVRAHPVTRATFDIPITRREVEQRGSRYAYQLVSRQLEVPPPPVMARFGIHQSGPMLHVKAVHLADNRPYIYEDRWIDTGSAPEILNIDLTTQSANEWLVLNKPYSRVDVRFHAIKAAGEIARQLAVATGEALLIIERTTWIGDQPITTVQSATAPGYQLISQG